MGLCILSAIHTKFSMAFSLFSRPLSFIRQNKKSDKNIFKMYVFCFVSLTGTKFVKTLLFCLKLFINFVYVFPAEHLLKVKDSN